jgi:hypothetical protein
MTRTPTSPSVSIEQPRINWSAFVWDCKAISLDTPTELRHRSPLSDASFGIGKLLKLKSGDCVTITKSRDGWGALTTVLENYRPKLSKRAALCLAAIHKGVLAANRVEAKPPDPARELAIADEARRLRKDGVVVQRGLL